MITEEIKELVLYIDENNLIQDRKYDNPSDAAIEFFDKFYSEEFDDDQTCKFLKEFLENFYQSTGLFFNDKIKNLYNLIVKNNYTTTINMVKNKYINIFAYDIVSRIYKLQNVELYLKYCNPDDIFENICYSLKNQSDELGELTQFILNNYPHKFTGKKYCANFNSLSIKFIKYLIDIFCLSFDVINLDVDFFYKNTGDDVIEICELLAKNCQDTNINLNSIALYITRCKNPEIIKYFIEKYPDSPVDYHKLILNVHRPDIFKYLMTMIDLDSLSVDYFSNRVYNVDCARLLIDYGFKIRPYIEEMHGSEFVDLILEDAIKKADYKYIVENFDGIYNLVLYEDISPINEKIIIKIIELSNTNIIKCSDIITGAICSDNYATLKFLIHNGLIIPNIADILTDLQTLNVEELITIFSCYK